MGSGSIRAETSWPALSTQQVRAVCLSLPFIIFIVDVTMDVPVSSAYFGAIAITYWSRDPWMPAAVSISSAVLLSLALVFTDKGLPQQWLAPPRLAVSVVMLSGGWLITRHRRLVDESRHRELVLQTIFDSEPACVTLFGPDSTLVEINRGGLVMVEADALDAVQGQNFLPFVTAPHRPTFAQLTKDVFEGRAGSLQFEMVGLRGTHRWLETRGAPLRDEKGRITAMLAVSQDITLRRQAEALLRDSEQRLHQAAAIAELGFFEYDNRTNRVYWSDGIREILGLSRDAMPGLADALEWTHPDDRERCMAAVAQAHNPHGDGAVTIDYRIVRPDGEVRRVSIRSQTQFEDAPEGRHPIRTLGTVFDVTERHRAEEQRDALALRLLQVQEDERRAVARDLHDEIGQALSALKLNLLSLRRDTSDPARVVGDSLQIADEVLRQVRDLALSLRPVALDDLGLGAAVQWYVEQTAARTGLDLSCTIQPDLPAASPITEIACFRVLQEALTNVHRHAHATHAHVRLSWDGTGIELVVKDDGIGFRSTDLTRRGGQADHMGLIGIRERASLLRGEATVTSSPGAGCEVRVKFPVGAPAKRTTAGLGV